MDNFSFKLQTNKNIRKILGDIARLDASDIEAEISNRQRHAGILEYGSGIYGEGPGARKTPIHPRSGKALLIPVVVKYFGKLSGSAKEEALRNAKKHPDIMGKLKAKNRNLIGFLFRSEVKGIKPVRMVRSSIPAVKRLLTSLWSGLKKSDEINRKSIATMINRAAVEWLRLIVKKTPVLTSNLKTGWTISKLAK